MKTGVTLFCGSQWAQTEAVISSCLCLKGYIVFLALYYYYFFLACHRAERSAIQDHTPVLSASGFYAQAADQQMDQLDTPPHCSFASLHSRNSQFTRQQRWKMHTIDNLRHTEY